MEGKDWTMVSFAPSGPVAISEKEGDYGLYLLSGIGWQYLIPSLLWARKKVLYCLYCRNELNSLAVSVHIEVHFYSHFSASFLNSREFKMLLLLLLFNCSVLSISLWSHGLQHARLLCPSPSPRVCSNSGPLSRWCYLTISSSVVHFSSCPQSFPTSRSFPVSQLFASGGQSIGASASASVLPMCIQGWFPLVLASLAPCCPRDFQESSSTLQFESINSLVLRLLFGPTITSVHDYWKNHSFDCMDLCQQNDVSAF